MSIPSALARLRPYEAQVLRQGLADTGGYKDRALERAAFHFNSGHSLANAIMLARKHFGFSTEPATETQDADA